MSDEFEANNEVDPLDDPEERRVLFAALDSFRYVETSPSAVFRLHLRSP